LLSSATSEVHRLIVLARQWATRLAKPVRVWMSDKQEAFVQAIATVRENKKRYAEAEARIRSRPHVPENPFGYVPDFGGGDD